MMNELTISLDQQHYLSKPASLLFLKELKAIFFENIGGS